VRFDAVTLAYNDEGTIAGTIKCLKPFVDRHVVLISETPYFGKPEPPDGTEEICLDLGCEVIKGHWALDNFQRNLGNQMCKDSDWVFTFDSDEMMEARQIERLIRFSEKCPAPAIGVTPEVYWYDIDHVLRPKPEYQPMIMMRPSVRFSYIRNITSPFVISSVDMHHLSWCSPKDIYKKVMHYAHATDFDGDAWYRANYISWDTTSKIAKLPTGIFGVDCKPLPDELRGHLENIRSNAHIHTKPRPQGDG
jgi:glycosyltransferase involved in cell wall biosynthesis